ncbi:Hypothetical protein KVN_LOCUS466 [uncultured virus]|nr:Hypothetical protein KVN_LOCUS466 [uncultured virus]
MDDYEQNFVDYLNTSQSMNNQEDNIYQEKTQFDEILETEMKLDQIYQHFSKIWIEIIEPYILNENCPLLNKTNKIDFINEMLSKNQVYNMLVNHLNKLKNC